MLKEDIERLEREASIFRSKNDRNWKKIEEDQAMQAHAQKLKRLQAETNAKQRIPINNEGDFEDVSRRDAITRDNFQRKRYAQSKVRSRGRER